MRPAIRHETCTTGSVSVPCSRVALLRGSLGLSFAGFHLWLSALSLPPPSLFFFVLALSFSHSTFIVIIIIHPFPKLMTHLFLHPATPSLHTHRNRRGCYVLCEPYRDSIERPEIQIEFSRPSQYVPTPIFLYCFLRALSLSLPLTIIAFFVFLPTSFADVVTLSAFSFTNIHRAHASTVVSALHTERAKVLSSFSLVFFASPVSPTVLRNAAAESLGRGRACEGATWQVPQRQKIALAVLLSANAVLSLFSRASLSLSLFFFLCCSVVLVPLSVSSVFVSSTSPQWCAQWGTRDAEVSNLRQEG